MIAQNELSAEAIRERLQDVAQTPLPLEARIPATCASTRWSCGNGPLARLFTHRETKPYDLKGFVSHVEFSGRLLPATRLGMNAVVLYGFMSQGAASEQDVERVVLRFLPGVYGVVRMTKKGCSDV